MRRQDPNPSPPIPHRDFNFRLEVIVRSQEKENRCSRDAMIARKQDVFLHASEQGESWPCLFLPQHQPNIEAGPSYVSELIYPDIRCWPGKKNAQTFIDPGGCDASRDSMGRWACGGPTSQMSYWRHAIRLDFQPTKSRGSFLDGCFCLHDIIRISFTVWLWNASSGIADVAPELEFGNAFL